MQGAWAVMSAIPFSLFPTELLAHDLSALELRVLIALYSFRGKNTNTVWPSRESLAEVAGIKDPTQVSKITSRLAQKGMLTKKKKGFTGCNSYELIVPDLDKAAIVEESSILDKKTMEESSIVEESSILEESSSPMWTNHPRANVDESSTCNEQTIEQTIEQTNIQSIPQKTKKQKTTIDYQAIVDAYNEILPERPKVLLITKKRITALDKASKIGVSWSNPDFWKCIFREVRHDSAMMNGTSTWGGADFDFIIREANAIKIYEKAYQRG
jgi:hypothetical protein